MNMSPTEEIFVQLTVKGLDVSGVTLNHNIVLYFNFFYPNKILIFWQSK